MDIFLSTGTGSGKSTLTSKLELDGYLVSSEFTSALINRGGIESNMDLYHASIQYLEELQDGQPFMLDRHPLDYLVGSVLLSEINILQAYDEVEKLNESIKRPQAILISPLQGPVQSLNSVYEKKSRQDYWEKIFKSPVGSDLCNVHKGMTISRDLTEVLVAHLRKYSDYVLVYHPQPTIPSQYFTWHQDAVKIINNIKVK